MITTFSVSNFRSFSSEETLSFVASNRLSGSHESHAIQIPDSSEKVLRAAVLYGANGAGKSNLFKALKYLKSVALFSREKSSGTRRQPYRFNAKTDELSTFDLQFIVANKLYRFGFKVDDHRIAEEWLIQVIGGRERIIYERVTDSSGNVTIDASGLKSSGEKLQALATVGGPQNQSFLATINVTLEASDYGEELLEILTWLKDGLVLISPDAPFRILGNLLATNSDFRDFAGTFLKSSSTGVDHLAVSQKEITEEDLRRLLPDTTVSRLLKDLSEGEDGIAYRRLQEGTEIRIERAEKNHFYLVTIQAAHEQGSGDVIPLELSEESDGTRRLLNLLPALHHLRTKGAVLFHR